MKKIILIATLCAIFLSNLVNAKLVDGELLFESPTNSFFRISPDGKYASYYYRTKENKSFALVNLETNEIELSVLIGKDNRLRDYIWLNDKQIYMKVNNGRKDVELIGTVKPGKIDLAVFAVDGGLVHALPDDGNKVLYAKRAFKRGQFYELYIIDVNKLVVGDFNGAEEINIDTDSAVSFTYDDVYKRILAVEYDEDEEEYIEKYTPLRSENWKVITRLSQKDYKFESVGFISENKIAVLTNKDTDKVVLRDFDIEKQELGEIIYQHPEYDLKNARFNKKGELVVVTYTQHGLVKHHYFDKGVSKLSKRLAKTFGDKEVYFLDKSEEAQSAILVVNGSDQPGEYFVYNTEKSQLQRLMLSYPSFDEYQFSKSKHITVKSTDGTEIEAFLNLPSGIDHSTLLVMPHGGPISIQESDRFNQQVQYFNSRGFAVLRVNFRGSGGFGKAFQEQGVGEFGKLIEEDIMAAVDQVGKKHSFKNMCSIGASYGGYSAAMLAIKNPERFDCVISSMGIFDLKLLFNSNNFALDKDERERVERVVGKDRESLIDVSPVYLHKKLKAPILLIGGRKDDIADFEHTNRFHYVLKQSNHPVETFFYDNTGHGHNSWWGVRHEAAATYDFLMRTLKLEFPNAKKIDSDEKEALAYDFAILADGYSFDNIVESDEEKAFKYYQKAADYDEPRSVFNIGAHYHRGEFVEKDFQTAMTYYEKSKELDYHAAYRRIGLLNMNGERFKQDWDKAFENLEKANELEFNVKSKVLLGRFYCSAPEEYRDVHKCLKLLNLENFRKRSKSEFNEAKKLIRVELARVIAEAELSKEERNQIKDYLKLYFDISKKPFQFALYQAGTFDFKESKYFGERGEYINIDSGETVHYDDNEKKRFGIIFSIKSDEDSERLEYGIAVKWTRTRHDGFTQVQTSNIYFGTASEKDWKMLKNFTDLEDNETWKLEIFNFNQEKLYERNFYLKPTAEFKAKKDAEDETKKEVALH